MSAPPPDVPARPTDRLRATALALLILAASGSGAGAQAHPETAARLARADAAFTSGDRVTAEREYAAVVAGDSSQSRALYRLAELRQDRDPRAAVALLRRYVRAEPQDAWGFIALGDLLAVRGDGRGAREAYASAMRLAPRERDVHVGLARALARTGHVDEAIRAYRAWLSIAPDDAESWRALAALQRAAGRPGDAVESLTRTRAGAGGLTERAAVDRELARARQARAAVLEPFVVGSRDSDATTTTAVGVQFTSPATGGTRLQLSASSGSTGDATASRRVSDLAVGAIIRPLAQLELALAAGVELADRSFIDTTGFTTQPGGGGGGMGPGRRPGGGPGIGRPIVAGQGSTEAIPVGRARLLWRAPGDRLRLDARASRQLLDASPYLVAQGVTREEIGAEVDVRAVGPVRLRAFGRAGQVGNADERNDRRIVGGAIAFAPAAFELSLRGQELSYGAPTALAYFAPRYVRTVELTGYVERELGDVSLALDLGAGMQRIAAWTEFPTDWSPALRLWGQVVKPLTPRLSLGGELEVYDARVGVDMPTFTVPQDRWRYGAARLSLRTRL